MVYSVSSVPVSIGSQAKMCSSLVNGALAYRMCRYAGTIFSGSADCMSILGSML